MHSVDEMCRAGCTTRRGVRFWEEQGLLGAVSRSDGKHRQFTAEQMDRARIIAAASFGGWKLEEIKQMLDEWGPEAHDAILHRLSEQAMAAARLGEVLPRPHALSKPEYDL
jgi:DNA-binding transcriptional MerR regulator